MLIKGLRNTLALALILWATASTAQIMNERSDTMPNQNSMKKEQMLRRMDEVREQVADMAAQLKSGNVPSEQQIKMGTELEDLLNTMNTMEAKMLNKHDARSK